MVGTHCVPILRLVCLIAACEDKGVRSVRHGSHQPRSVMAVWRYPRCLIVGKGCQPAVHPKLRSWNSQIPPD